MTEQEEKEIERPYWYTWTHATECRDIVKFFDFWRGAAIKYIFRAGKKPMESEAKALKKAIEALKNRLRFIEGADYNELIEKEEMMRNE